VRGGDRAVVRRVSYDPSLVPTFEAVERHLGEWFDPVTVVYSMRRDEVIEHLRQAVAAAGIPSDGVATEPSRENRG